MSRTRLRSLSRTRKCFFLSLDTYMHLASKASERTIHRSAVFLSVTHDNDRFRLPSIEESTEPGGPSPREFASRAEKTALPQRHSQSQAEQSDLPLLPFSHDLGRRPPSGERGKRYVRKPEKTRKGRVCEAKTPKFLQSTPASALRPRFPSFFPWSSRAERRSQSACMREPLLPCTARKDTF